MTITAREYWRRARSEYRRRRDPRIREAIERAVIRAFRRNVTWCLHGRYSFDAGPWAPRRDPLDPADPDHSRLRLHWRWGCRVRAGYREYDRIVGAQEPRQ